MGLELTRAQEAGLKAGKPVEIVGQAPCPVEPGYVLGLRSDLTLVVTRVDWKGQNWKLRYELTKIEPPRLLRRTPPVVVPKSDDDAPTAGAIYRAGQESSYTTSPAGAIEDAGEAVDAATQDRFSREGQQDRVRRMADYEKKVRERPLHEQLQDALEEAKEAGVDVARYEQSIEKRIEAVRRRTRREAA